jgi:PAS domain S-box-containing protein
MINIDTSNDASTTSQTRMGLSSSEVRQAPAADDGVWYLHRNGKVSFCNQRLSQMLGYAASDIVGHDWTDFLVLEDRAHAQTRIERCLRGSSERIDFRFRHKNGAEVWTTARLWPNNDDIDHITGLIGVFTDIAERHRTEQALYEWEQRLQLALAAAQLHIWTMDLSSHVVTASAGAADIFGMSSDEPVAYEDWLDRVHPSDRQVVVRACESLVKGKARYDIQYRVVRPDGEIRWVNVQAIVVQGSHRRARHIYGVAADITEQKRAERELYQRQQEFKTLVENAPDIISRLDRELRHLYVNPAVESAWGVSIGDYLGRSKAELGLPHGMVKSWEDAARAAFATGREQHFNFSFPKDGATRYYSARVLPEFDRDGLVESVLCIAYDETDRTEIQIERDALLMRTQTARNEAEAATRARDEFLAVVSHELRSPLNAIQSWTHVLETQLPSQASQVVQRALQGIRTGVAQQVRLIENLLDVTGMISGKLHLAKRPLPFLPVVQSAVESVMSLAATKHITIDTQYDINIEQIEGDADRIRQVIWNLLSNAIKFTPYAGHIWVHTFMRDESVVVTVRDNGVGISPAFLPQIFRRFRQADASNTRAHGGLGLGLSMAHHLVELHGGRIAVESPGEGQGATFSVSFPLFDVDDIAAPSSETSRISPSLRNLRILVVDDYEEARESLTTLLSQNGAKITAASSGEEALRSLNALSSEELPQILLCDIAMPDENGYSVLRRIRAWRSADGSEPLNKIPAVALTAFAQSDDRLRAFSAGFQVYLAKPIAPQELISVVVGLTRPS